ncbi:MAG: hypothetical protein QOK37_1778 [Thermoanaerobaculia bacterium]|jgi:hypothetical protein|nr:hypothetical protein [Thermoanaerobaculia bacterium]
MNIKRILAVTIAALLPLAASASTMIVPASGTGPGANDSHWQTELTLHNTSSSTITTTLTFHDALGAAGTSTVSVAPRATIAIADIVGNNFGQSSATGAIEITFDSAFAQKLSVSSRTFNKSAAGEFGQDIPAADAASAPTAGNTIVLSGPSSATGARFNFGVYAVTAATVQWELVRADGSIAATKSVSYASGSQNQYNYGVSTFFNASSQDNDTVHAVVTSGRALAYGSTVNNASGDPTYVPGVLVRPDLRINFLGVSLGDTGRIDVADANHDGVLDRTIEVPTGKFPTGFRVVVASASAVKFELVNPPSDVSFFDANGGIIWAASATASGTNTTLTLRVTADGSTEIITIPVHIQ